LFSFTVYTPLFAGFLCCAALKDLSKAEKIPDGGFAPPPTSPELAILLLDKPGRKIVFTVKIFPS